MRFTNSVEIDRRIDEVFAYLADFENVPSWNYAIAETRKLSDRPVGVGTTYRQTRSLPRRSDEEFEVAAFDPHRRLAIRGTLGPFSAELEYRLEPMGAGTRLTNEVALKPRGVLGVAGRLAGSRVKVAMAGNLLELKRILESGGS